MTRFHGQFETERGKADYKSTTQGRRLAVMCPTQTISVRNKIKTALEPTIQTDLPPRLLVWSAIVNGVISVPIMVAMMLIGQSKRIMGAFIMSQRRRFFRWVATVVMGIAVLTMFVKS